MPNSAMTFASAVPPAFLDVSRVSAEAPLIVQLRAMKEQSGLKPSSMVRAFASLTLGPGKIAFPDFVKLRLFDKALFKNGDLKAFVGQRRNRDLCVHINSGTTGWA